MLQFLLLAVLAAFFCVSNAVPLPQEVTAPAVTVGDDPTTLLIADAVEAFMSTTTGTLITVLTISTTAPPSATWTSTITGPPPTTLTISTAAPTHTSVITEPAATTTEPVASTTEPVATTTEPVATTEPATTTDSTMSTSLVPSPEPTTTPVHYVTFTGDGSEHAGWPTQENWLTFNDMFKANGEVISKSCSFKSSWGQANSPQETQDLYDAILQVAGETNFDERMILAVVMQESSGCMRVEPTYSQGGVFNPGLMQDHNGTAMCHDIDDHLTFPCPKATIVQMIREGTSGTPYGKGLIGVLEQARNTLNDDTARSFYAAARLYNSGEYSEGWESDLGQATAGGHCYSSDIANRLIGWVDGPYGHCELPI